MKKSLIALSLLLLTATSCRKQLDTTPLDAFPVSSFYTSESNALLALTALYRGSILTNVASFNPVDWWDYNGLLWMELATDNAYDRRLDNSVFNKLTNGTLLNSNLALQYYWTGSYYRIAHCNDFLENIGQVPMDETKKKRMIAEARFIRACQYFYLETFFNSVPLVTKVLTPDEANNVSKASHADLVKFTIAELTAAAADLPRTKDIPPAETGRASKQAALAFLGRTQLGENLFADAAVTYKIIIDFGDNIIDPNYSTIFLESNENSKENIFSIQFIPNLEANAVMQHHAPAFLGGYELEDPLGSLMEAYQFTDGTPFSYTDPRYSAADVSKNRDPRLRYTIYYPNAPIRTSTYNSHPDASTSIEQVQSPTQQTTQTGYGQHKWIDEGFTGNLQTGYGGNLVIIRYAEVLLSYLEAKMEAGQAIDQALLDATVNQVRGRASVGMPKFTATDPSTLRPLLRNERRVELALEGIRLWDIFRWKIGTTALVGDFYGAPYPGSVRTRKKSATAPADPYGRWYVTTKNFRPQDYIWPIPLAEVSVNPKLAQ
jgi:hypothetical protein